MQNRLQVLFTKYMDKTASMDERSELGDLLITLSQEERRKLLANAWEQEKVSEDIVLAEEVTANQLLQILKGKTGLEQTKVVPIFPKRLLQIVAAAIFLIIAVGAIYFFFPTEQTPMQNEVVANSSPKMKTPPATQGAILILADGSSVVLDSVKDGQLSEKLGVTVTKDEVGLSYEQQITSKIMPLNTVVTPRGRQYVLSLADGTKVWLNAATKLRFPVAFPDTKERQVELEGEAYFEVAPNPTRPFIVKLMNTNGCSIKVLGTSFNILSYSDEPALRTTVVSGAIQFNTAQEQVVVQPGQQSVYASNATKLELKKVDINENVAWKNGMFQFENTEIKAVMRQLSRWYDLDVIYEGEVPPLHFKGKIQRNLPLEDVIEILEADLDIRIEGKNMIISRK